MAPPTVEAEMDDVIRLPGELPRGLLRSRDRHSPVESQLPIAQNSWCIQSDYTDAKEHDHSMQVHDSKMEKEELGKNLLKSMNRLDDIVQQLMKSCKVKPEIDTPSHVCIGEMSINPKVMEERLDGVIRKLSQRGYASRFVREEPCMTPRKAYLSSPQHASRATPKSSSSRVSPLSSSRLSSLGVGNKPQAEPYDGDHITTPTSSFRMPLLTPRSLLSKFGSCCENGYGEQPSPTSKRRLSGSSSRSGRFTAALSFLVSPKKGGGAASFPPKSGKDRTRD